MGSTSRRFGGTVTGDEAKALIVSIFGAKAPTFRAAKALDLENRTLQRLYRRPRISRRDEFALLELQRRHRIRAYGDILADLQLEAMRQAEARLPPIINGEPK